MKFSCLLFATLFTWLGFGQEYTLEQDEFDNGIRDLINQYEAVGISVAIVKGRELIYSKGFGYRDLNKKLPVTENTVFHIASMTKAFTGSLLGILEAKDQLSLQDRPGLFIPNFQFYNDKMNNLITLEDLLSHKSGLGNHGSSIVLFPETDKLKTVQRLRYLRPEAEVKNSWVYSNIGYTLAGTVVEQITNKSWEANVRAKLFDPLQMNSSFISVEAMKETNNYAIGYAMSDGQYVEVPYENYYSYTPAGAIKSTVKDLSNWMSVWLNKGDFEGLQIIPEKYIQEASRPQNLKYNEEYSEDSFLFTEGFGWRIRSWNGHYRLRHGGNTSGFSTVMELFPFKKIGIVVLCNRSNSTLPYIISDYISRAMLQLPAENEYPVIVGEMYKGATQDKPLNKNRIPTHTLKNFVGSYKAKGYGHIKITEEENKLFAQFPTFKFKLEHIAFNDFYMKGLPGFKKSFNPEFTLRFVNDYNGEIMSLELLAQKEPTIFNKTEN